MQIFWKFFINFHKCWGKKNLVDFQWKSWTLCWKFYWKMVLISTHRNFAIYFARVQMIFFLLWIFSIFLFSLYGIYCTKDLSTQQNHPKNKCLGTYTFVGVRMYIRAKLRDELFFWEFFQNFMCYQFYILSIFQRWIWKCHENELENLWKKKSGENPRICVKVILTFWRILKKCWQMFQHCFFINLTFFSDFWKDLSHFWECRDQFHVQFNFIYV